MPVLWCTGSSFKPLSRVEAEDLYARAREIAAKFKDKNAYEIPAGDHGTVTLRVSKVS